MITVSTAVVQNGAEKLADLMMIKNEVFLSFR